jgi:hypothetical protein
MCQNIDESHYKSTPYKVESVMGDQAKQVARMSILGTSEKFGKWLWYCYQSFLLIIKELANYIYIKIQTREEKEKWRSEQKQ